MLALKCLGCGHELAVPADSASLGVVCPRCGQTIPVDTVPTGSLKDNSADTDSPGTKPTSPTIGPPPTPVKSSPSSFRFLRPPDEPGDLGRLGNYRVKKLLGQGGMGMVFEAVDVNLQRSVALKVMRPEMGTNLEFRQRFLREARTTAAIKSDYIVTIHQVGQEDDVPFLAMEFLEGMPLERWRQHQGRLPIAEVVRIGIEVALGLWAAHQRDLIHRDIKPANIWIEQPGGRVKILDFGLARVATEANRLTQTGLIMGTPEYMAPEQAEGAPLDARCDLYSLGCVLYELLAGQPPFTGPTVISVLRAAALEKPTTLRMLNREVPRELSDIVMQLLAKKPEERYPNALQVAEDLQRLGLAPVRLTLPASAAPRPTGRARTAGPRRLLVLGLAALVCLAGGAYLIVTHLFSGDGPGPTSAQARATSPATEHEVRTPTGSAGSINGGGSSFIAPLMKKWTTVYRKEKSTEVNYVVIGSGAGIHNLLDDAFEFACSDAPLSDKQLQEAREKKREVVHVPLALGGVVPTYNLEGVDKPLRLSGPVLAEIFLGEISRWNDPEIQELNAGVDLPNRKIEVVHRGDESGTSYVFAEYLSKVSPAWRQKVGSGTALKWPVGRAAKRNEGVTAAVLETPGSIGYVELLYALQNKMKFAAVKNKEGNYLQGSLESVTAAADAALDESAADLRFSLTNAPGKDSYPMSACTWALVYAKQPKDKGKQVIDFLRWATHEGQEYNTDLYYARLPQRLAKLVDARLKQVSFAE
jgi:phosphate transport system substrate-binding protein